MSGPQQSTSVPTTPSPTNNNTITLHVGERLFTTRPTTLTHHSTFFARQLSPPWTLDAQADGSYFIDADGDVFAHVLRYMRHGIFPVFYDGATKGGHDFARYVAVLEQAQFFGVEPLRVWLEGRKYLAAVKVERVGRVVEVEVDGSVVGGLTKEVVGGNVAVEQHVGFVTRKVYVCPRDIGVHRGDRNACGRDCRRAQGDADDEYEDEAVVKVFEVRKTTTLDPKMCVEQH